MQLFILDRNPIAAAHYLADCHVIKMCLETAQILSGVALRHIGYLPSGLPKPQNTIHPVIKAINTDQKMSWVLAYFESILEEYSNRFNKEHAYYNLPAVYCSLFPSAVNTEPECEGLATVFTNFNTKEKDIVEAHRAYYKFKKSIIKKWKYTNSKEPNWL